MAKKNEVKFEIAGKRSQERKFKLEYLESNAKTSFLSKKEKNMKENEKCISSSETSWDPHKTIAVTLIIHLGTVLLFKKS